MNEIISISSKDARQKWRELLDTISFRKNDILIKRNGKPVAVMLPAEDYNHILEALEDYRDGLEAEEIFEAWKAGKDKSYSLESVIEELG